MPWITRCHLQFMCQHFCHTPWICIIHFWPLPSSFCCCLSVHWYLVLDVRHFFSAASTWAIDCSPLSIISLWGPHCCHMLLQHMPSGNKIVLPSLSISLPVPPRSQHASQLCPRLLTILVSLHSASSTTSRFSTTFHDVIFTPTSTTTTISTFTTSILFRLLVNLPLSPPFSLLFKEDPVLSFIQTLQSTFLPQLMRTSVGPHNLLSKLSSSYATAANWGDSSCSQKMPRVKRWKR